MSELCMRACKEPRYWIVYYDQHWNEIEHLRESQCTWRHVLKSLENWNRAIVRHLESGDTIGTALAAAQFISVEMYYAEI